jgi:hypothetical protein
MRAPPVSGRAREEGGGALVGCAGPEELGCGAGGLKSKLGRQLAESTNGPEMVWGEKE